jgi:hypothetical protein
MKRIGSVVLLTSVAVLVFLVTWGCGNPTYKSTAKAPRIDEAHSVLIFQVPGYAAVGFSHKDHAGYYGNSCLVCHTHTNVRDDSIWGCGECHSDEDYEQLCPDDAERHDCLQAQCAQCHATLIPNPTPPGPSNCFICHNTSSGPGGGPPSGFTLNGTVTYYGAIESADEVDQFVFTIQNDRRVTIDVESFEAGSGGGGGGGPNGPQDFFNNGNSNDRLVANIFLWDSNDVTIASKTCQTCLRFTHGCCPGADAPGAFSSRSGKNPYMNVNPLVAGTYTLAIGANPLSDADAKNGYNTDGSYYSGSSTQNYRITLTAY